MVPVPETKARFRGGVSGKLIRSTLAHNVMSLYAGQAAMYLAPLITIPYLTRVLGPAEWGRYSFAMAISVQLALLVDFGFGITASRTIATLRDSPSQIGLTLGAAIAAKLVLMAMAACLAVLAFTEIPSVHRTAGLFWFAAAAGITQGLNFSWYLYGVEKIAFAVALDLGSRLAVAGAMVALVRTSQDAWIFFALQIVANVLVTAAGLTYILRSASILWPGRRPIASMLVDGIHATLSRCGFGIFTGVNTFLLGLYATSDVVGQYAGAERIARVVTVFPMPISQALFPRISHSIATRSPSLSALRMLGSTATIVTGAVTSIVTFVLAPLVTKVLLGPGFETSGVILRILSPLPLLVSCNQVLLYQYLFPAGELRIVSLCLTGTTLMSLAGIVMLGYAGRPNMFALAADVAEAAAMACLIARVGQKRAQLPVQVSAASSRANR